MALTDAELCEGLSSEMYRGLSQLFLDHEEFRAYSEKFHAGLADFMQAAIDYYCDHMSV